MHGLFVASTGIEPVSSESESEILSIKPRGQSFGGKNTKNKEHLWGAKTVKSQMKEQLMNGANAEPDE